MSMPVAKRPRIIVLAVLLPLTLAASVVAWTSVASYQASPAVAHRREMPRDWTSAQTLASQPAVTSAAAGLLTNLVHRSAAYREGLLEESDGPFIAMPVGSREGYDAADAHVLTRTCTFDAGLLDPLVKLLDQPAPSQLEGPCAAVRFDDANDRAFIVYLTSRDLGQTWTPWSGYSINETKTGGSVPGMSSFWPATGATAPSVSIPRVQIVTPAPTDPRDAWIAYIALAAFVAAGLTLYLAAKLTGALLAWRNGRRRRPSLPTTGRGIPTSSARR